MKLSPVTVELICRADRIIKLADLFFTALLIAGILILRPLFPAKVEIHQIFPFSFLCIGIVSIAILGSWYSNDYISKGFSILLVFTNSKTKRTIHDIIFYAIQAPINNVNPAYLLPDRYETVIEQIDSFNKAIRLLCILAFAQRKSADTLLSGYSAEAFLEIAFKKEDIEKYKR